MELNYDNSKTNLEKNEKVIKSISIKPNEQIKCISALNFIFSNNSNNDFQNEIKYFP